MIRSNYAFFMKNYSILDQVVATFFIRRSTLFLSTFLSTKKISKFLKSTPASKSAEKNENCSLNFSHFRAWHAFCQFATPVSKTILRLYNELKFLKYVSFCLYFGSILVSLKMRFLFVSRQQKGPKNGPQKVSGRTNRRTNGRTDIIEIGSPEYKRLRRD